MRESRFYLYCACTCVHGWLQTLLPMDSILLEWSTNTCRQFMNKHCLTTRIHKIHSYITTIGNIIFVCLHPKWIHKCVFMPSDTVEAMWHVQLVRPCLRRNEADRTQTNRYFVHSLIMMMKLFQRCQLSSADCCDQITAESNLEVSIIQTAPGDNFNSHRASRRRRVLSVLHHVRDSEGKKQYGYFGW